MRWVALIVVLGIVAGCSSSSNGQPVPASVATQVWSLVDGFDDWPALPGHPPGKWSLNLEKTFPVSDGNVPTRPYAPGVITGLTSATELVADSAATGKPAWRATLPPLASPESGDDKPLVESLQVLGLDVIAVTRQLVEPAGAAVGSQIDLYDAGSGQYLFSRSGPGVTTPMLLDSRHALFDLTDTSASSGLDEVDVRTGRLLWHTPNVAACSVYVGKIVCDTSDAKGVALVDPATGAVKWSTPFATTIQGAANSTTAVVGDEGFFGDGSSDALTAINLDTGHVDWKQPTGFSIIGSIVPLDAAHVAVDGLVAGADGSTEQVLSMSLRDGGVRTIYRGTDTDGSNTTNGGLTAIKVGGTEYVVVVDPEGSVRTFGAGGGQVAMRAADCGSAVDIVGDTLGCDSANGYTLYALPGLEVRGNFDSGNRAGIAVVGGVLLADVDDTVRPLTP